MNIRINIYNASKNKNNEKVGAITYRDIKEFAVKVLEKDEVFSMGLHDEDDFKEYLIVTMKDGSSAIFKYSLVDVIILDRTSRL